MQIELEQLTQLAEIHKKLSTGYHISEQDFALWQELDANEEAYAALFTALGNQLKRDSRGYFHFDVDDATVNMGKISRLFALTTYALVEFFADQGQDPLRALFEVEISHEILASILQQQYHLFEQLEVFSATDLKREVMNRMLRYGFAKAQGEHFKLLSPVYRYLDALMAVDQLAEFPGESAISSSTSNQEQADV
jgi:hypothetical protein